MKFKKNLENWLNPLPIKIASVISSFNINKRTVTTGFMVLSMATLMTSFAINDNHQREKWLADGDEIKPGKRKAVLILSDGRKIELSGNDTLIFSNAGMSIKVDSMGISYKKDVQIVKQPTLNDQKKAKQETENI